MERDEYEWPVPGPHRSLFSESLPRGDGTGQHAGGRQAAPGVTAQWHVGHRGLGMDRTTLLAKRSALEPLPGQEAPLAQLGRRSQELSGRAGAPSSAQEESTWSGGMPCAFLRTSCFLKC